MHIERLLAENVRHLGGREHDFTAGPGRLRQWNRLPADNSSSALLRSLALTGMGWRQVQALTKEFPPELAERSGQPVHLEFVQVRHAPQERGAASPVRRHLGCGWCVRADGRFTPLPKPAMRYRDPAAPAGQPESGKSSTGWLLLGYAGCIQAHAGTDRFDVYPDQRVKRCAGLFAPGARVTDPVAFLRRLHHKSRFRAGRARALLARLSADLSAWLGWDVGGSLATEDAFETRWQATSAARRTPVTVALDMVRHVFDASTRLDDPDPLQQPGVVLLDGVESWCEASRQPGLFKLLDAWFPRLQFFVALSPSGRRRFPADLAAKCLAIPEPQPHPRPAPPRRLPGGTVLLVDVDGTLPNLALMKLSRHFQSLGRKVALARGVKEVPYAETVLASAVFSTPPSAKRIETLRRRYGASLQLGGSGVDLRLRLAPEIEGLAPDYSLYPELGDRALGFLTRGCPRHCSFCVVPVKEGPPRRVSDLDTLLQGRNKLILLDDNLLAHPSALELLEEIARRDLAVNFNQTLDLRLLTPGAAALLRRIRCSNPAFTRRNYYFSLNDARHLELARERYALLQANGRDNVEFVCMYGFNTSLAEDVARFRFLRSLPGAYVFVQRYQPVPASPAPDLSRLFDERADALLDELVQIVFTQNMKSMETYYRWLALQYAAQCGRIHHRLVETLFRYNGRPRMGGFLHRLENICRQRGVLVAQRP
jgi:hypothetical protein